MSHGYPVQFDLPNYVISKADPSRERAKPTAPDLLTGDAMCRLLGCESLDELERLKALGRPEPVSYRDRVERGTLTKREWLWDASQVRAWIATLLAAATKIEAARKPHGILGGIRRFT